MRNESAPLDRCRIQIGARRRGHSVFVRLLRRKRRAPSLIALEHANRRRGVGRDLMSRMYDALRRNFFRLQKRQWNARWTEELCADAWRHELFEFSANCATGGPLRRRG